MKWQTQIFKTKLRFNKHQNRNKKCRGVTCENQQNALTVNCTNNDATIETCTTPIRSHIQVGVFISLIAITSKYDNTVFWLKNFFVLLSGSSGEKHIEVTTKLMN